MLLTYTKEIVYEFVPVTHHVSQHTEQVFKASVLHFKNSYLFVDLDEGTLWRVMSPALQILRSF